MPPRLLAVLLLLAPALLLFACGDGGENGPEVEITEDPADVDDADLLGYWTLIEENDRVPQSDRNVRYQFTAQGDFIRYEGSTVERARFTFASADQITIDGPTGTRFLDYELDGEELVLRDPGEDGGSLRLRKLADQNLEDVPPPVQTVPEEDSLPTDSMRDA